MSTSVEVVDKNGWRKVYPLQKAIISIGSDQRNDIVLEGSIYPRHAQLIAAPNHGAGYQLVNLANVDIQFGQSGEQVLSPHGVKSIVHGDTFILGDFTLIFSTDDGSNAVRTSAPTSVTAGAPAVGGGSRRIGLSLSLPQKRLMPNQYLDGIVIVQNRGEQTGVQFELELLGLDPTCYDIEPGPLLSSGAEKEVFFRLYHRGMAPPAGETEITIRAVAPRAYLGEEAILPVVIEVMPLYRHKLKLLPPGQANYLTLTEADLLSPKAAAGLPVQQPAGQSAIASQPASPQADDLWSSPDPAAEPSLAPTTLAAVAFTLAQITPVSPPRQESPPSINPEALDLWGATAESVPPTLPSTPLPASAEAENLWGSPADATSPLDMPADSATNKIAETPSAPETDQEQAPATATPTALSVPATEQPQPQPTRPVQSRRRIIEEIEIPSRFSEQHPLDVSSPPVSESVEAILGPQIQLPAQSVAPIEPPDKVEDITEAEMSNAVEMPAEVQAQSKLQQWWRQLRSKFTSQKEPPTEVDLPPARQKSAEFLVVQPLEAPIQTEISPQIDASPTEPEVSIPDVIPAAELPDTPLLSVIENETLDTSPPLTKNEPATVGEAQQDLWEASLLVEEPPVETQPVLKLKDDAESVVAEEASDRLPKAEDWWSTEPVVEVPIQRPTAQVIKLKADASLEAEEPLAEKASDRPPEAEDWWSTKPANSTISTPEKEQKSNK